MLFKLSNLNSNLAPTLGYLNPAMNNSAQVVITHASHVCKPAFVWTSTKNEWNAQNAI